MLQKQAQKWAIIRIINESLRNPKKPIIAFERRIYSMILVIIILSLATRSIRIAFKNLKNFKTLKMLDPIESCLTVSAWSENCPKYRLNAKL
jgi:hypothetical protein